MLTPLRNILLLLMLTPTVITFATAMLAWWLLITRGGLAAAAAFGYANYRQWVLAQLPMPADPNGKVEQKPTGASPAALLFVVLLCVIPILPACASFHE